MMLGMANPLDNLAEASREIMGKVFGRARPKTPEHRAKLSASMKGRRLTWEHKKKISDAMRAAAAKYKGTTREFSAAHRRKLSQAAKKRGKLAWTTRVKISRALQGRVMTPEHREKIRQSKLGKPRKTKQSIRRQANAALSITMKAVWVLRKAEKAGGGTIPPWLDNTPEIEAARAVLTRHHKKRPGPVTRYSLTVEERPT